MAMKVELGKKLSFRISPLLEMALSLLVVQNPERFAPVDHWVDRVTSRLPHDALDSLRHHANDIDYLSLASELAGNQVSASEALERLRDQNPDLGTALTQYWNALAPDVAANAGILGDSIQRESARLQESGPVEYLAQLSDRVEVDEENELLILDWGKGMQLPLNRLSEILLVPSTFCPRRLMFYRHGSVQTFFYNPLDRQAEEGLEPPESMVLGFSALADLTRLKLLKLISRAKLPAREMAQRLDVHESTVSRHLKFLTEAGLVGRESQEGKFIFYTLNLERVDTLAVSLRAYLGGQR